MMVFKEASKYIEDFRMFNMKEQLVRVPVVDTLNRSKLWKSPVVRLMKVNWDASLNLNAGIVGLGCVIRNDEGLVLGAKCSACKVQADPLLAEAMAALLALDFSIDMGFSKIVSEGDSLQVIKGMCDPDAPLVRIGHYLETIRQKDAGFSFCTWVHCCREANDVAHVLAREASLKCLSNCWIEEMPHFISTASYRDYSVSRL
jgi:hypothetical protein